MRTFTRLAVIVGVSAIATTLALPAHAEGPCPNGDPDSVGQTCREYIGYVEGVPVPAGEGLFVGGISTPTVTEVPMEAPDLPTYGYLTTKSGNTCYYRPHNWWSYSYQGWDSASYQPSPSGDYNQYVQGANNRSSLFGGSETSTYRAEIGHRVRVGEHIVRAKVSLPWSFKGVISAENNFNTLGNSSAEVNLRFLVGLDRNGFNNKQQVASRSIKADNLVPGERAATINGSGGVALETATAKDDVIKGAWYFEGDTRLETAPGTNARAAFNVQDPRRGHGHFGGVSQRWDFTLQSGYYLASCG